MNTSIKNKFQNFANSSSLTYKSMKILRLNLCEVSTSVKMLLEAFPVLIKILIVQILKIQYHSVKKSEWLSGHKSYALININGPGIFEPRDCWTKVTN